MKDFVRPSITVDHLQTGEEKIFLHVTAKQAATYAYVVAQGDWPTPDQFRLTTNAIVCGQWYAPTRAYGNVSLSALTVDHACPNWLAPFLRISPTQIGE